MASGHAPHHYEAPPSAEEVLRDGIAGLKPGPRYRPTVIVLAVLSGLGVVGVIIRIGGGFEDRAAWGYYAAVFAYLLTTAMGAPVLVFATRLAKGHWARPVRRAAGILGAVSGLVAVLWFIPLMFTLPPFEGRNNIWFDWPLSGRWLSSWAPAGFDLVAVIVLAGLAWAALWADSIPDLAVLRDRWAAGPGALVSRLARGWIGTPNQWFMITSFLVVLGAFYIMFWIFLHMMISADFSMSLVPGWRSAIYPAYHALSGLQGTVAVCLVMLYLLRRFGGLERYLGVDQFWGPSKLLLATTILIFYFTFSDFHTFWYGRLPNEQAILHQIYTGPNQWFFYIAFTLCFPATFLLIIWNPIRKSILGPPLVSLIPLVGLFFDRIRLYAGPYAVPDPTGHELELSNIGVIGPPDIADVFIMAGGFALVALLFILMMRLIPIISIWDVREGTLLQQEATLLRLRAPAIAKPR